MRTSSASPGSRTATTWPSTIICTGTSAELFRKLHRVRPPEHHRAGVQRVRRDERDHVAVGARDQHRPAGREVVGGRAGRAGGDHPVASELAQRLAVDAPLQDRHPARRGAGEHDVVDGGVRSRRPRRRRASAGRAPRTRRRTRARAPHRGRVAGMLVRNPTRPKFTPRQGMPVPRQRWSARSIVPSPPSTTTMSGSSSSTTSTPQRAATARSRSRRVADDLGPAVGQEGRARDRHAVTARRAHVRSGLRHRRSGPPARGARATRGTQGTRDFRPGPGHKNRTRRGRPSRSRSQTRRNPATPSGAPRGRGRRPGEHRARPASNWGFTSDERPPRIGGARQHGREHEPERDERDVGRDEARAERQRPAVQRARVRPVDHRDPGIGAEALVELVSADVERDDGGARRAGGGSP